MCDGIFESAKHIMMHIVQKNHFLETLGNIFISHEILKKCFLGTDNSCGSWADDEMYHHNLSSGQIV